MGCSRECRGEVSVSLSYDGSLLCELGPRGLSGPGVVSTTRGAVGAVSDRSWGPETTSSTSRGTSYPLRADLDPRSWKALEVGGTEVSDDSFVAEPFTSLGRSPIVRWGRVGGGRRGDHPPGTPGAHPSKQEWSTPPPRPWGPRSERIQVLEQQLLLRTGTTYVVARFRRRHLRLLGPDPGPRGWSVVNGTCETSWGSKMSTGLRTTSAIREGPWWVLPRGFWVDTGV